MQFSSFVVKTHINIFSNQWQLQAFQLAAHLGDKTKVFINDGDPLVRPHSNCLFSNISGWVCSLFLEAYLPQVWVQDRNFCTGNSLLSRKVIEWGKRVKVPLGCVLVHWNFSWNLYPDLQSAQKDNVIFSNRYIHIPRTSKYPEKLLKLWKLCGKLPFLWWLGGSKIYMHFWPWKRYTLGGILTVDCRIASS